MKYSILLIVLTLFYINVKSQNVDTINHPIDAQLEACMSIDSNYTTYGTLQCIETAINAWNNEMEKYYHLLLDTINPQLKEILIDAQNTWIIFKSSETSFLNAMYDSMQGTMWKIAAKSTEMQNVRDKAIILSIYYFDYTFE